MPGLEGDLNRTEKWHGTRPQNAAIRWFFRFVLAFGEEKRRVFVTVDFLRRGKE